jgi:hypothetical protein
MSCLALRRDFAGRGSPSLGVTSAKVASHGKNNAPSSNIGKKCQVHISPQPDIAEFVRLAVGEPR